MTSPYRAAQEVIMQQWLSPDIPKPIVDLGGGGHRGWMMDFVGADFETWDAKQRPDVTRVADACRLRGVEGGSLGTVICVSVLEHVRNPWSAAHEIARVTRADGLLFVAAPFIFGYHRSPEDYWRFSPAGLRELFRKNYHELACDWFDGSNGCYFAGRRRAT